jgi:tRNA/rRNA methyltransferase
MMGPQVSAKNGRPVVDRANSRDLTVREIVTACHDTTIDQGLAALSIDGLDRTTLEPILTYCAEKRCVADDVACPGCRRDVERKGWASLDDLLKAHSETIAAETGLTIRGQGREPLTVKSFEYLAATWRGEEGWFEARRVIRKLRHGVRTKAEPRSRATAAETAPAIILVEPQLPDNIGMVARAMANFGLDRLRLVNPRDGWPNERAQIAASGATFIVEEAVAYPTLSAAMADLNWVAATTARQRDLVKPVLTPEQAVAEMLVRTARGQRCGLLFGRERNGLETSEIAAADAIVMAPVDPDFASLNLAQAVLLLAYEWIKARGAGTLGRVTTYETPVEAGLSLGDRTPATKEQLDGFLAQLEGELDRSGFLKVAHKRPVFMQNLRSTVTRLGATEQEIRTMRGIVKALSHGKGPKGGLP